MISTSRSAGLMVLQHICKYFYERAHYMTKARDREGVVDVRVYMYRDIW